MGKMGKMFRAAKERLADSIDKPGISKRIRRAIRDNPLKTVAAVTTVTAAGAGSVDAFYRHRKNKQTPKA
jgi:hypothetical protein